MIRFALYKENTHRDPFFIVIMPIRQSKKSELKTSSNKAISWALGCISDRLLGKIKYHAEKQKRNDKLISWTNQILSKWPGHVKKFAFYWLQYKSERDTFLIQFCCHSDAEAIIQINILDNASRYKWIITLLWPLIDWLPQVDWKQLSCKFRLEATWV